MTTTSNLSVLSTLLKRRFGPCSSQTTRQPRQRPQGAPDAPHPDLRPHLHGHRDALPQRRRMHPSHPAPARTAFLRPTVVRTLSPSPPTWDPSQPRSNRHTGMDGMISKPVRFQNFQQYLCPLSIEASEARGSVTRSSLAPRRSCRPCLLSISSNACFFPTDSGGTVHHLQAWNRP